jgi:hypothetical protein
MLGGVLVVLAKLKMRATYVLYIQGVVLGLRTS